MYGKGYEPRMGPILPRALLAPRTPANLRSARVGLGFTLRGAVSTREIAVFVRGSPEL